MSSFGVEQLESENNRRKAPKNIGGRNADRTMSGRNAGFARTQGPLRGDEESSIAELKKAT